MVKLEAYTSLAKTSKNKQINLEELHSAYQRMIFTWVCQQCQEVSHIRRQVFCEPHMVQDEIIILLQLPFQRFIALRLMAREKDLQEQG